MQKGLLIVHTGNGKGKTTAALGLALRTLGHGWNVCLIQFIKGDWKYGELLSAQRFQELLDWHVMGDGFLWTPQDRAAGHKRAREAWVFAQEQIASEKYRLVILDELTYLINYGIISQQEALACFAGRKADLHVVVTGRDAPQGLLDAADLVTEMIERKHPFQHGVKAQKGIEF